MSLGGLGGRFRGGRFEIDPGDRADRAMDHSSGLDSCLRRTDTLVGHSHESGNPVKIRNPMLPGFPLATEEQEHRHKGTQDPEFRRQ